MGETITLQRLLEIQKKVWNFRIDRDDEDSEYIAREQLKSFAQISQLGSYISPPCLVYVLVKLFLHLDLAEFAIACSILLAPAIIAARNFVHLSKLDVEAADLGESFRRIHLESILNAVGFSSILAFPLALGLIPFTPDIALLALSGLILGGFAYGSIPRAQSYYNIITTLVFSASFLIAGGMDMIAMVTLFMFVGFCLDYIYRMFFFNFAQRHLHAAKQRNAAETVRLLLHDYAEQSSDWLWEIDGEHRIVNPSARFATALDKNISELKDIPFVDLFEDSTERNHLVQSLELGEPFRDLQVPITIHGNQCWWNLSGRKMSTSDGTGEHIRGVASDISAAKHAEARVAHLAHFDALTDLPNRALFHESLQRSIARLRKGQMLAVLYLDLDHFKTVNDTMGHGAGDQVLRVIANRLETVIGLEDVVARLSGDEFAVSLRNVQSEEQALETTEKIIAKLSVPVMIDAQPVTVGVSAGVALCRDTSDTAEDLLKNADIALYQSKNLGRGCATAFEPSMRQAVQDRRSIEMDLRTALKNNQLELYYQPLINIETSETVGYEALLRWNHPQKGMVMPDVFIPIAEETGLIVQLGEWVLRSALHELKNWPEHLSVAVNLSPTQMRSANLIPTIVNALAATGVEPRRLELEITETVLMSDSQANIELLHKIRSLGVRIALDDFGTGYSSLNYLRSFPFDKIKIDRCFVEDVDSRDDCRAIIRAVTGLASSLGMITTAEGVERDDQLQQLRSEGCEQVQGYLFSKAVPAASVKDRKNVKADVAKPVTDIPVEEPLSEQHSQERKRGAA